MSRREPVFRPPSLAQHFEAPDEFTGRFGWLCGYSADAAFLDDAAERFTRRTTAQRAHEGRIALAVMLDPSNPQIEPKDVPGALHLPLRAARPFRLLHAKVALLGFRHATDSRRWRLRLIVSTGNWTRATLEESLDLAWRVDISREELDESGEALSQACADLKAAWNLLGWVRERYDDRALRVSLGDRVAPEPESVTVEKWIARATKFGRDVAPRFFDNRDESLLARLPALIRTHCAETARNYLAMGSGFYEAGGSGDEIPSVLSRIVERLTDEKLLTAGPEIDVFVNPKGCQAVADTVDAFADADWSVREAGKPSYLPGERSLHAKFVFGAINRGNSEFCNSAWLYLGSGNLTGPGFANRMSPAGGNLEAGVVFEPETLRWYHAKGVPPECVVTNVLPLQWDTDFNETPSALAAGEDMPEPSVEFAAAPVAHLLWHPADGGGWLRTAEAAPGELEVLGEDGSPCPHDPANGYQWTGPRPRQVRVRWRDGEQDRQAWVPVIDEYGRVAATILPRLGLDEAWTQLANFPMPPDDEEIPTDGDGAPPNDADQQGFTQPGVASYPVRQMMQLIENIAAKQTAVSKADWTLWCSRFEQSLTQAAGSQVLEEFKAFGLNPLSPLRHGPFRPDFATGSESPEARLYDEVLGRVERAWGVDTLGIIGGVE